MARELRGTVCGTVLGGRQRRRIRDVGRLTGTLVYRLRKETGW